MNTKSEAVVNAKVQKLLISPKLPDKNQYLVLVETLLYKKYYKQHRDRGVDEVATGNNKRRRRNTSKVAQAQVTLGEVSILLQTFLEEVEVHVKSAGDAAVLAMNT